MNNVFFIIDIDGTVSNSLPRVKDLCASLDIDYEKDKTDLIWNDDTMMKFLYEENMMQDDVVVGAEHVLGIASRCKATPIFLTGRDEYAEEATRKWLTAKLGVLDDIQLIMRPRSMKGIYTADCKEELFKLQVLQYHPNATFIFFEDDLETAQRYAKYGLVLHSPGCWEFIK